jgi:hypothetical protein
LDYVRTTIWWQWLRRQGLLEIKLWSYSEKARDEDHQRVGVKGHAVRYSKEHKQATRQRIIEAAGRRFKTDGIDGSGIAALRADAGLTNGAFYAPFRLQGRSGRHDGRPPTARPRRTARRQRRPAA